MEWLLDNIAELVAWRATDGSVELELITGGGDPLPESPEPVLILTLINTTPSPPDLESDLSLLSDDGVWNVGHEPGEGGVRVTLDGEGWSRGVSCRDLEQRRLPLQPHHYERIVKRQKDALDRRHADEHQLRQRLARIEKFLDQQVDRAERILTGAGADMHEPRLRAEGRLRLAQELRNVLSASDERS